MHDWYLESSNNFRRIVVQTSEAIATLVGIFRFIVRLTKHLNNRTAATANHCKKVSKTVTLDFVMTSKTDTDTNQ
jgi:hypothetical protein